MIRHLSRYLAPVLVLTWTLVIELIGFSLALGVIATFSLISACKPYLDELFRLIKGAS